MVDNIVRPMLNIDSHVVFQLGAELISDVEQALLELVKNAYDGDATECSILVEPKWCPEIGHYWREHLLAPFDGKPTPVGRIIVRDDGTGLDQNAVLKGWLTISASLKRAVDGEKKRTARDRTPVGDKGLGRLATMRLGDVLLLRTMTNGEHNSRLTSFAWSDFQGGKSLSEVHVQQESGLALERRKSGTDVEILGLLDRGQWDERSKADSVVARLTTLITPFKRFKDFQVRFVYDEEPIDLQDIATQALNYASAKFSATWNGNEIKLQAWFAPTLFRGKRGNEAKVLYEQLLIGNAQQSAVEYLLSHKQLINRKPDNLLGRPGGWLYTVQETINATELKVADPIFAQSENPGPFDAELYYFLYNQETVNLLSAAGLNVDAVQNMSRVAIFRDGFRVRVDDDWLNLSEGTTTGGFFQLRPRNVVGFFALTNRENPGLIEKSDREGFVDNAAWRGFERLALRMRKFSNDCLDASRTAYGDYIKFKTRGAQSTASDLPTSIQDSQAQARVALEAMGTYSSNLRDKIYGSLSDLYEEAQSLKSKTRVQELRAEVALLYENLDSSVASAKDFTLSNASNVTQLLEEQELLNERNLRLIDAAAVGLSARSLAHEMSTYVNLVEKGIRAASKTHKEKNEIKFVAAVSSVTSALRELKKIVSSIDPLMPGSRSLKETFFIGDAVRQFADLRRRRLLDFDISIDVVGDHGARIRFSRTRFNQVFENLFQNSLYWLRNSEIKSRDGKSIKVVIGKETVTWSDSGPGVRRAIEDTIFEPYVSDKSGQGQGLGLHIVNSFLRAEKCEIVLSQERNANNNRYKFIINFSGASSGG